ncbi:hypothetical protein BpHYR1_011329 [Brachionus plicatilis]|uniref:Uncharacterized protein n=1 Tax=Brachionus plicatilis TaxID=10195 RepID=A0A3M7Q2J6_BRAPC|nr:hypothetical protein BpHYR1_011329 [Brachionus plicatilis]
MEHNIYIILELLKFFQKLYQLLNSKILSAISSFINKNIFRNDKEVILITKTISKLIKLTN